MAKNSGTSCSGMLSIRSIFNRPRHQTSDVSLERTFSNDSTIDKDTLAYHKLRPTPRSPKSAIYGGCDIFRPIRETFFSKEVEDMISLRRANPVCCSMIDSLSDDEDDEEEEHKSMGLEIPYFPLVRQDAVITSPPGSRGGSTESQGGQSRYDRPGKVSRSS
jgi:hypothetical protein